MVTAVGAKGVGVGGGSDGHNKGNIEKERKFEVCHLGRAFAGYWTGERSVANVKERLETGTTRLFRVNRQLPREPHDLSFLIRPSRKSHTLKSYNSSPSLPTSLQEMSEYLVIDIQNKS